MYSSPLGVPTGVGYLLMHYYLFNDSLVLKTDGFIYSLRKVFGKECKDFFRISEGVVKIARQID